MFLTLSLLASPAAAQFVPGTEFYNQPALSAINLLPAYAAGLSGAGVRVGVIDSGINPSHVEFTNAILAGYDSYTNRAGQRDFASYMRDYYHSHGSVVASVIAARLDGADRAFNMQGVAYRAGLLIAAMSFGGDEQANAGYMATSFDYVSGLAAKVINNSWESTSGRVDPAFSYMELARDTPILLTAIDNALARGSVLVFASGNDGAANPGMPAIVPTFNPAIAARGGYIVVAATNNEGTALTDYSNRCGIGKEYCMAAPGGSILPGYPMAAFVSGASATSNDGYLFGAGTSFAAPIVSGAVALVAEQFPWMNNKNLAVTVLTTASRAANPDAEWGRGLLDVGKAIRGPGLFEADFEANLPVGHRSVFSNDIADRPGLNGGLIKLGGGTLILSGTSTYTGNTVVDDGALVVNGSLVSPVAVGAGGSLRGTGNLSGNLSVDGVLAPGDPVGTLTASAVTLGATGSLHTALTGSSAFGKLRVAGDAVLPDNARIVVEVLGGGYNASPRVEDIIEAGNLVSNGHFSVSDNALLFNFSALKDGNTLDLVVQPDSAVSVQRLVATAGLGQARAAAAVIDGDLAGDPASRLAGMFGGFASGQEAQLAQAVHQTLPLLSGEMSRVGRALLGHAGRIVQARQDARRGLSAGSAAGEERALWFRPFATRARQENRSGVPGYDVASSGFALGAETALNADSRLGLAFVYADSRVNGGAPGASQRAKIDSYLLLGYGSHALDADSELRFQAGLGGYGSDGHRRMAFAAGTADASYRSLTATAGVGLLRTFRLSEKTSFVPSIAADYRWVKERAYRETGPAAISPLLLGVSARVSEELILGVNGQLNYRLHPASGFSLDVGVAYDALNRDAPVRAVYAAAPAAPFATPGVERSPWLARVGLSWSHRQPQGAEFRLSYDAESRSGFLGQSASAVVRWVF